MPLEICCGALDRGIGFFKDFDPFSLPPESSFCSSLLKADNFITLLLDPRTKGARTLEKVFFFSLASDNNVGILKTIGLSPSLTNKN